MDQTSRRARWRWWLVAWAVGAVLLVPVAHVLSSGQSGQARQAGPAGQAGSGQSSDPIGVPHVIPVASRSPATVSGPELGAGTRQLSTASMGGSVVVVNIWAAWCEPCKAELPALARLAARYGGAGVRFVGLDVKDDRAAALSLLSTLHVEYPSISDPDGSSLDALDRFVPSYAIPSTLVLDRQGRVALTVIGPVDAGTFGTALADVIAR
jgi:thiol-disulfide isomerase/thioredoxin